MSRNRGKKLSFRPLALTAITSILLTTGGSPAFAGQAELVSTIDTSQLSDAPCPGPGCIASSDPSGITFLAPWDSLLVTDSEVEEIPTLFTGDNLFEITTSGLLLRTLSTVSFSNEPTGVTWNPAGGRLLFSDDAADEIFELDPGPDGLFGTPDDVATTILDTRDFLSFDPEGVTIEASTGSGTVCSVATQDAYFHQDAPDHSHGTGNDLKVKPDVDKLKHSVLEFDLSAIPAGSRVVSSSLLLWEDDTRDNQRIHVHRVTSGWVESGVSWEERNPGTAWTTPGGDFDSAALASFEPIIENQYREIDVTGVTQAWVNGTFPNHGLLLRSTGANGEVKFKSREEGNEEKRPLICVDYETSTTLWIADGVGARVYRVTPGPNGAFDGVAPLGDDEFTSFDTAGDGLTDIEGIAFNSENRYLYVVGRPVGMLAEYTTQGELVRLFDISAASPLLPSGLTFAPGSLDPSVPNIYITDRRVDNQTDPEENDGRIYEMSLPEVTPGNHRPLVDAGPDQLIKFPVESISLNGTVVDDGLPNPPGAPTITWRQVSGPGTVSFAKASSADTVASFSAPGTYVLRLAANDGELVASDDVTITVLGLNGEIVVEIRVAKGSDDAEERFDGDVAIGSVDIEMVDTPEGGGGNETVGYRFEGVPVPPGSEIVRGYVQFKADESHDVATYLTIYGEKVGDSATFVQDGGGGAGISSRPKTAASISWSPPPWTAGQVGPAQRTPDIAPILQEVVDQLEWVDGNALTILIDGQGKRVADSADGNPFAPLLHLEFIPPAPPSCVVTGEGSFNVDDGGKELVWQLTNSSSLSATIESIDIRWPQNVNGDLKEVRLGSPKIFDHDVPSPALIEFFEGELTERRLEPGGSQELRFKFENEVDQNPFTYSVQVDFAEGCSVIFEPGTGTDPVTFCSVSVADAYFHQDAPDHSHGDSSDMKVKPDQGKIKHSVIEFDLSAIPAASQVISSTLMLWQDTDPDNQEILVHRVTGSWTEAGVSWDESSPGVPWTTPGGDFEPWALASFEPIVEHEYREIDVTGVTRAWVDGTLPNHGLLLRSSGANGEVKFKSREEGDEERRPLLCVTIGAVSENQPPTVTISEPANGSTFNLGDTVHFAAAASDPEDGHVTSTLSWNSHIDGFLGTGGYFSRSDLSVGVHTITATATDSGSLTGSESITIGVSSDPSNSAVLVGAGDIAECDKEWDEATADLLDGIEGTVMTLGDNSYPDGTDWEFNNCYDPSWGRHKARTRPSSGNHEYHTLGASGYYNYFGAAAGDADKGYYSYDLGEWHIIVLNTQCSEVGGCNPDDPQGQWLQADLAANPRTCTLAYFHKPAFSSGSGHGGGSSSARKLWQTLYAAGVDVVLGGHSHTYERFALQDPDGVADPVRGIRQFIVGTGGTSLGSFGILAANSEVRNADSHGVLKLTLHPTSYQWEFIPIAGDTFTDSGSSPCVD